MSKKSANINKRKSVVNHLGGINDVKNSELDSELMKKKIEELNKKFVKDFCKFTSYRRTPSNIVINRKLLFGKVFRLLSNIFIHQKEHFKSHILVKIFLCKYFPIFKLPNSLVCISS